MFGHRPTSFLSPDSYLSNIENLSVLARLALSRGLRVRSLLPTLSSYNCNHTFGLRKRCFYRMLRFHKRIILSGRTQLLHVLHIRTVLSDSQSLLRSAYLTVVIAQCTNCCYKRTGLCDFRGIIGQDNSEWPVHGCIDEKNTDPTALDFALLS